MSESDQIDWEGRFRDWLKANNLPEDAQGFAVFKALMEKQESKKKNLVIDLEERFATIDRILKEVPGQSQ